jgi:hypothetical protein
VVTHTGLRRQPTSTPAQGRNFEAGVGGPDEDGAFPVWEWEPGPEPIVLCPRCDAPMRVEWRVHVRQRRRPDQLQHVRLEPPPAPSRRGTLDGRANGERASPMSSSNQKRSRTFLLELIDPAEDRSRPTAIAVGREVV